MFRFSWLRRVFSKGDPALRANAFNLTYIMALV